MPNPILIYPVGGGAPPPPATDIYGPTRIVSLVPGEGTDLTIAAALAALPPEGGYIQVKEGVYPVAASLVLPDKNVVIRGAGEGATIIDIGANVIPAFTIPNGLAAQRTFTFEDLRITGASVANQRGWSIQDDNKRGIVQVNRCETYEVERIFEVAHAGANFVSTLIYATDCYFQQIVGNTSVLIANSPSFKQVQITMDRVRFYRAFQDTVVGQLAQGGLYMNFSNVNVLAVDSVFALGAVDFNVGALNLNGCSIVNNAPIPNFKIGIASDNDAAIEDSVQGCRISFTDFDMAGTGTKFSDCNFDSCSFNDTSISAFDDCYFAGIGTDPATAVVVCASETVFSGCYFDSGAAGSSYVLEDPAAVVGCLLTVGGPTATIQLTNGASNITGNYIAGAVPIRETVGGNNVIDGNTFPSGPPSLVAASLTIIDDRATRTIASTPVTLNQRDRTLLVDATGGARVVNLPAAASAKNHVYTIKKIDASVNTVTIDGSGAETIDGSVTVVLTTQWERVTIQSDGTAWFRID